MGPVISAGSDAPPDEIVELAETCRQYVYGVTGVELDYTPDTLGVLDHYLTLARAGIEERPELLPLAARAIGAYFGEVVRRVMPSFWVLETADDHDWRVCARTAFLSFNPVGVAHDALAGSTEHSGPSSDLRVAPEEREIAEARLAQLPDVPEEDYYLMTTRLEVIEVTYEALRLEMEQQGTADVRFDESDYSEE